MAIDFRCVQCQKLLRTSDDTAGKQAKCPECGTVMTIPAASAAGGALPPAPLGGDSPIGAAGPLPSRPTNSGDPFQPGSPFTPAGAASAQYPIRRGTLDLGDVFSRTWTIFKPDWGICLAVVVIVWAIGFGVNMVTGFIPIVGAIVGMLFEVWISIGQAMFFLKKARGQNAAIEDIFHGWPYFGKILLASILVGLISFGIIVVCMIPLVLVGLLISREATIVLACVGAVVAIVVDVYVMLVLSQFYYLILDRNVGVIDSLKMSKELTEGNKLTLLCISLLSALIMLAALIPCGLGLLVAVPYFTLMQPTIYLIITSQPTARQIHAGPAL